MQFEHPVVFISCSRDMGAERDACRLVIDALVRDLPESDRPKPYAWGFTSPPWTGEKTWQHSIPRTCDPKVRAVICLLGERIGTPLPASFTLPPDFKLPDWIVHPWPEGGVAGKIPLTGTLFELLDCREETVVRHIQGKGRLLIYIKTDYEALSECGKDVELRRYGFEHFKDSLIEKRAFNRAQQQEYNTQIDWLDLFCEHHFRSAQTRHVCFGSDSREASLIQFQDRLRHDLGALLGITPRRIRRDPKGLFAYQPEDWDILFGRDNDSYAILVSLHAQSQTKDGLPLLLLGGQSGQGKSSVLRAGLVGRIRHDARYASFGPLRPVLLDASLCTDRDPLLDLAAVLADEAGLDTVTAAPALDCIAAGERPAELVRRVQAGLPPGERLLVAVDQAETLVLHAKDGHPAHPGHVLRTILELARNGLAWAVLATTQEHEQTIEALFGPDGARMAPVRRLGPPDRHALERIVREAFEQAWLPVDRLQVLDIVEQAVSWIDDHTTPGAVLPLLSVLLAELVAAERKRRQDIRLRSAQDKDEAALAVPRLAGVLDALGEQAWAEAEKRQPSVWRLQAQFARLMRHLVNTKSDTSGAAPNLLNCRERHPAMLDADPLVTSMQKARLLFCPNKEASPCGDQTTYDLRLSHPAIVEHWQRARKWYEEDRDHHTVLERIREEAENWRKAAPDARPGLLERRRHYIDLMEALWVSRRDDAEELPVDYLRACLAAFFDPGGAPGSDVTEEGDSRLSDALWIGDAELIRVFRAVIDALPETEQRRLVNYENPTSTRTPLFAAAIYGTGELVRWLLQRGANPGHVCLDGQIPLHNAAFTGNTKTARELLTVFPKTDLGPGTWTPLLTASSEGHADFVRLLLDHGADITLCDSNGVIALMVAAQNGYLDVAKLLLERGAPPQQTDVNGRPSLIFAAINRHLDMARLLLERGAKPDKPTNSGMTALMFTAYYGHHDVARLLLEHGALPNMARKDGGTALMLAAQDGHCDVARLLLEHEAAPDKADNDGRTALMLAAQDGHCDVARLLLEHNVTPDKAESNGWTALMFTAENGHCDVARLLLKHGAMPDLVIDYGATALMLAAKNGHCDVARLLLKHGAMPDLIIDYGATALMLAAENGHCDVAKLLLDRGAMPDMADNAGWTALMLAAQYGHLDVARLLLKHGAMPDLVIDYGATALMLAAENGHCDVARLLLEHGAMPDLVIDYRATALMLAVENGHYDVANLLLEHKAEPNMAMSNGWTALMSAAINGCSDVAKLLLEHKATPDKGKNNGWSAILFAMAFQHADLIRILLEITPQHETTTPSIPDQYKGGTKHIERFPLWIAFYLQIFHATYYEHPALPEIVGSSIDFLKTSGLDTRHLAERLAAIAAPATVTRLPTRNLSETSMFDTPFTALAPDAASALLADITPALGGVALAPETTDIRVADLPIYDDYRLLAVRDGAAPEPNVRYLLAAPGDTVPLNWTNEPIYAVNARAPIKLEDATVIPYAKFFFHFVRGQLGCFMIVEKPEDVDWLPEAPKEQHDAVNAMLAPVVNQGLGEDNLYTLTATVIFKNALFRTDIKIAPFDMDVDDPEMHLTEHFSPGQMKLCNEELLLEDLSVVLDPFPADAIRD